MKEININVIYSNSGDINDIFVNALIKEVRKKISIEKKSYFA